MLVYRVISQVHEEIVHVLPRWFLVRLGAESGHAFVVDVDSQRVDPVHEDIDSEIVLKLIDGVRVVNVVLDYPAAYSLVLLSIFNSIDDGIEVAC